MSTIDKQRIGAVRTLELLGYTFDGIEWKASSDAGCLPSAHVEADKMHTLLVMRADALAGCTENSEEEMELKVIADAVTAYETKRWPDGKVPGGKG